ncbi:hypothetical protein E2C01_011038 [Portunus trituberculatus]|uniref:Uncharacterized protein n=1 Tax=Portunus trituberculatus TaxID=210409 RepID=A0A5B7DA75_PORTR|nr:hypothetical protein [Portunus trituberculatus]
MKESGRGEAEEGGQGGRVGMLGGQRRGRPSHRHISSHNLHPLHFRKFSQHETQKEREIKAN